MMIAAMNPGRIKRLVLNDIGAFIPKEGLRGILDYVYAVKTEYASRREAETQLQMNMGSFGIDSEEPWHHECKYSLKEKDGMFKLTFDPNILEPIRVETQNFTDINDIDLSELWEAISIPTLVIRGEESPLLEKETVSAMRSANMKCQSVEVPGVGHAPPLLKPDQYQLISKWMAASGLSPVNLRAS